MQKPSGFDFHGLFFLDAIASLSLIDDDGGLIDGEVKTARIIKVD